MVVEDGDVSSIRSKKKVKSDFSSKKGDILRVGSKGINGCSMDPEN